MVTVGCCCSNTVCRAWDVGGVTVCVTVWFNTACDECSIAGGVEDSRCSSCFVRPENSVSFSVVGGI